MSTFPIEMPAICMCIRSKKLKQQRMPLCESDFVASEHRAQVATPPWGRNSVYAGNDVPRLRATERRVNKM